MKPFILYKHTDEEGRILYWYKYKTGYPLDELIFFLKEAENDPDWWFKILDNPTIPGAESNIMAIEKEDEKVYIWSTLHNGPEYRDPNAFETTISELKRIIKEWVELLEEKPDEIIVIDKNRKIELKGIFRNSKYKIKNKTLKEMYKLKWCFEGSSGTKISNFFPKSWSRKKVVEKIKEAYEYCRKHDLKHKFDKFSKTYTLEGFISEGVAIRIIIKNNEIILAYPII